MHHITGSSIVTLNLKIHIFCQYNGHLHATAFNSLAVIRFQLFRLLCHNKTDNKDNEELLQGQGWQVLEYSIQW